VVLEQEAELRVVKELKLVELHSRWVGILV
jgi:hypothetical protein